MLQRFACLANARRTQADGPLDRLHPFHRRTPSCYLTSRMITREAIVTSTDVLILQLALPLDLLLVSNLIDPAISHLVQLVPKELQSLVGLCLFHLVEALNLDQFHIQEFEEFGTLLIVGFVSLQRDITLWCSRCAGGKDATHQGARSEVRRVRSGDCPPWPQESLMLGKQVRRIGSPCCVGPADLIGIAWFSLDLLGLGSGLMGFEVAMAPSRIVLGKGVFVR